MSELIDEPFTIRKEPLYRRIGQAFWMMCTGEPPIPEQDDAPSMEGYYGPVPTLDRNVAILVQMSEHGIESLADDETRRQLGDY